MEGLFVRESLLQAVEGDKIRCNVCARRCLLPSGATGWCRTRENQHGRLVTCTYGAVSSLESDPIEKKPFYHFNPGSRVLAAGSWSCNLGCPWCENWEISHMAPPQSGDYISPERFVSWAEGSGCQATALSFNEPTLSLEWALDVFELAHMRGLYNTFISNGYMTPESLKLLIDGGLDALNVDIKGDPETMAEFCQGDAEKVWEVCKIAQRSSIHLEISTLIIPSLNDSEEALESIARRIFHELGPEVPWHVRSYAPAYIFDAPPTPRESLERAWWIGQRERLEYIYVDSLPGHRFANTHCSACDALLIRRLGSQVLLNEIKHGKCQNCGHVIPGIWK